MNIESKYTPSINRSCPLDGHPDPYWRRDDFLSLNGQWDFLIDKKKELPEEYLEKILVPFSPETPLSGIERKIEKDDYIHYRKEVLIDKKHIGKNALLRFMAVDQECDVYINGEHVFYHEGGYVPFSVFLPTLKDKLLIELIVHDDTESSKYARGKQSNTPKGIFYHPTSGIWQEVYLEFLEDSSYLESVKITGDFDNKKLIFDGKTHGKIENINISIFYKNKLVSHDIFDENCHAEIDISNEFHPWSPESPDLYDIVYSTENDEVHSIYGIRKVSYETLNGYKYLLLNEKPIFLNGVLDQGYFCDGGLTPPSIDALYDDIKLTKDCGFNCIRKHIKMELRRFYYLCDKEGIVIMQDMLNGGAKYSQTLINLAPFLPLQISDKNPILGRINDESKNQFLVEMQDMVDDLYNVSSIFVWTLFNEGWGQFDTKECLEKLKRLDSTRLIDATSGWYDKKLGDFRSRHIYFRPVWLVNDKRRLMSLTEFGGYSCYIKDHSYSDIEFGYKKFKSKEKLQDGLAHLFEKEVMRGVKKARLCIAIYTQLSDVEEEVNGLVTYDRKVIKVDSKRMRDINERIAKEYQAMYLKDKKHVKN